MSSTITETERRSVLSPSTPLTSKRQHLSRTGSIEKLKKFNNFICTQHYYILPSLLLWLKTSQTALTSNMEKCIVHVKSMFLLCTLRGDLAQFRCALGATTVDSSQTKHEHFGTLTSHDVLSVLNILRARCLTVGEQLKYVATVVAVYGAVFVVFLQLVACVLLICLKVPPIGFTFLVLCVCSMARIAAHVMLTGENRRTRPTSDELQKQTPNNDQTKGKRVLRKRLSLIGKTISNIKLF